MAAKDSSKNYVATRDFTDSAGRAWKLNDEFHGDEGTTANALEQGNIAEYVAPPAPEEQERQARR